MYSSVHINESKVLHRTEVTYFLTFPKTDYFETKPLKNIVALFVTLLLTPLKQKLVDYSLHNLSYKFLVKTLLGPFS